MQFPRLFPQRDQDQVRREHRENIRDRLLWALNLFLGLLALLAITSLVAEYGFFLSLELARTARLLNLLVLYGFIAQVAAKLALIRGRIHFIRHHWGELSVLLLITAHLLFTERIGEYLRTLNPLLTPEAVTQIYIIITQVLVLLATSLTALRYSKRVMRLNLQPSFLILISFVIMILLGTLMLLLPRASASQPLSFVDALFTATSAVCVTGLTVVDTATHFSAVGQTIIMILIQIGGLGIMTLTTFFAFVMGTGTNLKEYTTMQSMLGEENIGRIRRTVVQIALLTFALEAIGALMLHRAVDSSMFVSTGQQLFFAVFHSVSAFCNAGFTLTTENLAHPLLRSNISALCTIMALIVVGGIGFPVLANIGASLTAFSSKRRSESRLTVHTKLVIITTAALIVGGTAVIMFLESGTDLTAPEKFVTALFHSISARTAGFNTLNVGSLSVPTLFFLIGLMWVGASPGSTGGGVKTTTLALSLLNIHAIASGRNKVEAFRKRISDISITRAFSTIVLSMFYVAIALFFLLMTEHATFIEILFEIVSAVGTVGFSTGITAHLTTAGKIIIVVSMLVGRVGLLAVLVALTKHGIEGHYDYTQEHVLVT